MRSRHKVKHIEYQWAVHIMFPWIHVLSHGIIHEMVQVEWRFVLLVGILWAQRNAIFQNSLNVIVECFQHNTIAFSFCLLHICGWL